MRRSWQPPSAPSAASSGGSAIGSRGAPPMPTTSCRKPPPARTDAPWRPSRPSHAAIARRSKHCSPQTSVPLPTPGGEAPAGRVPVVGASRVAKLYVNLVHRHAACLGPFGWRMLNGLPALVAPGYALRVDVDADGRITAVHALLASRKLAALATPPPS